MNGLLQRSPYGDLDHLQSDRADLSAEIMRVCREIWAISGVAQVSAVLAYQAYLAVLVSL